MPIIRRLYDAIIYAVGASSDRSLGIAGEDLAGSISATEFVAWYNGHPDAAMREMALDARGVAVVGVGNVAVDVTRILAKTRDELAETDIADHALPVLARSEVTDIYVLGRRGPVQAKFTTKELGELGELANADIIVKPEEIALDPVSEAALAGQRVAQRNIEVLRAFATKTPGRQAAPHSSPLPRLAGRNPRHGARGGAGDRAQPSRRAAAGGRHR